MASKANKRPSASSGKKKSQVSAEGARAPPEGDNPSKKDTVAMAQKGSSKGPPPDLQSALQELTRIGSEVAFSCELVQQEFFKNLEQREANFTQMVEDSRKSLSEGITKELTQKLKSLEKREKALDELQTRLAETEKNISSKEADIVSIEADLRGLSVELNNTYQNIASETKAFTENVATLTQDIEKLREDQARFEKERSDFIDTMKAEREGMRKQYHEKMVDLQKIQKELDVRENNLNKWKRELIEKEQERAEIQKDIAELNDRKRTLQSEMDVWKKGEIAKIHEAKHNLAKKINEITARTIRQAERERQIGEAEKKFSEREILLEARELSLEKLKRAVETGDKRIAILKKDIEEMKATKAKLEVSLLELRMLTS